MSIQKERFFEILEEMGLPVETMSAFYKVAVGTRAVYLAKTQKVSRVDISGFDGIKHPAITKISEEDAKELKLGKVRAQLDFSKNEDRVLEAFRGTLEMMQHLADVPDTGDVPTLAKRSNRKQRKTAIKTRHAGRKHMRSVPAENNQHA